MKLADRAVAQVESVWNEAVQPRIDAVPLSVQDRIVGSVLFFPTAAVLFIATRLTPNPAGYGTHRELGLGACSFLTMFGIPCPMCGMTTTFTYLAHAHPLQGTLNQPFGLVLFLLTLGGFVVGGLELARPRGRWRTIFHWVERHETAVAAFLLIGMIAGWTYKIALMKGIVHFSA